MKHLSAMYAVSLFALFTMPMADAEVFKCINADGKISYSEKKEANAQCSLVTTPINVVPATSVTPASRPNAERGGKLDASRGQIAEQERALADAKKALAEQESIRLGDEKNYQRVLDRLKPYQDKVAEIEKKLAQLREEQGKAK
ncbi:MAG: DUF4124 domain-containing protein [Pseudomonadota bacterium]